MYSKHTNGNMGQTELLHTRVSFVLVLFYIVPQLELTCSSQKSFIAREYVVKSTSSNLTAWIQTYHQQHLTSEYVFKCPTPNDYRILCDHDWVDIHKELLNCRHIRTKYFRKIRATTFAVIGVETMLIIGGLFYVCKLRILLRRSYDEVNVRMSSIQNNPEVNETK